MMSVRRLRPSNRRQPGWGQEVVAERPDGTRVPTTPYPTPLFDSDGRILGAVNLLMNMSDQKNAEGQAQQRKALLEERVERRTLALTETVGKFKESTVANWNTGAERIKGYTRAEIRLLVQCLTDYAVFMLDPSTAW